LHPFLANLFVFDECAAHQRRAAITRYWLIWTQDRRFPQIMFRSVQRVWPFF
jgi:hypothetical protein